tara:strand:+ start:1986 stop:2159 length:174 start_codon:yes stop_codon:yes gene_type:complete
LKKKIIVSATKILGQACSITVLGARLSVDLPTINLISYKGLVTYGPPEEKGSYAGLD